MIMMKFVCLLTKKLEIPTIVSMNPIMVDGTGMCGACRLQVGDEIKIRLRGRTGIRRTSGGFRPGDEEKPYV